MPLPSKVYVSNNVYRKQQKLLIFIFALPFILVSFEDILSKNQEFPVCLPSIPLAPVILDTKSKKTGYVVFSRPLGKIIHFKIANH